MTTSKRLLSLLSLLQARRDWPGAALAERLDVSARTVRRDVDRLRELGYPIAAFKGPDGGYRLEAGAQLPPLLFDDEQAVALAVALQLATNSGAGIEVAAAQALSTVRQVMPSRLRHRIDAVSVTALRRPSIRPEAQVDVGVLTAIGAAVRGRETLRFDYASAGSEPADAPRHAEPHHLVTWDGRWYLVAWDVDRADWRTFRADRIRPRTPNGPRFAPKEVPGGDLATFVASTFRGSTDGTTAWPCEGTAVVHLPASEAAPYISDGTVEAVGADRCRVTLGSWSWIGLAASLARFDADIEVVGPRELAESFATLARRFDAAATIGAAEAQASET
jgi:predicted DNA-binding transcriptional regulator YafY